MRSLGDFDGLDAPGLWLLSLRRVPPLCHQKKITWDLLPPWINAVFQFTIDYVNKYLNVLFEVLELFELINKINLSVICV